MIKKLLAIIVIVSGLMIFLYPSFSNLINNLNSTKVIAAYSRQVKDLRPRQYAFAIHQAQDYNQQLAHHRLAISSNGWQKQYDGLLNIGHNGLMGYIVIGKENIRLPIYHGTGSGTLEVGAGHLDYTSLPVGGRNTHSVIVAHSGLPSAKMFDDIHKLKKGDQFSIHVLNKTLIYRIEKIKTVRPENIQAVRIVRNQDLVSLMTCTPIGINNRRLMITGVRVQGHNEKEHKQRLFSDCRLIAGMAVVVLLVIKGVIDYRQKNKIDFLYHNRTAADD